MPLAQLWKGKGTLGGDVESWGRSSALHSPGIENVSMLLTPSKKHSAMLQSWLYRIPKPNIACTSTPASTHWAQCSPKCKTRQRKYWVISAVNYTMRRQDTLHMTENYWASETQYYTGNSTYTEPSNHSWYTRIMRPCVGSSHSHISPYVKWTSWRWSKILTGWSSTSRVSRIRSRTRYLGVRISDGSDAM